MPPGPAQPALSSVHSVMVQMTVGGEPIRMRVDVPKAPIAPAELLPLYRALVDRLATLSQKTAAEKGQAVSCRMGCAACCRQAVAITPLEARELVKLINRLPEPQRSRVRQRFADARRQLYNEAPHLLPRLMHPQEQPSLNTAGTMAFAREYIRLRIACPFLEDEACSIYADRPLACRQHLVVSPREHCADLAPAVRTLDPIGGPASHWIPTSERTASGGPLEFVALILAPDFVATHPDEPPRRPGPEILNEFLARMQQRGTWSTKEQP